MRNEKSFRRVCLVIIMSHLSFLISHSSIAFAQDMKPCGTSVIHRGKSTSQCVRQRVGSESPVRDYLGEKRGLIILVAFPNQKFKDEDPQAVWSAIANQEGYADNGAKGSVSDYFHDQSYGQFRLSFDVVGPVETKNPYAYYGKNRMVRPECRRAR